MRVRVQRCISPVPGLRPPARDHSGAWADCSESRGPHCSWHVFANKAMGHVSISRYVSGRVQDRCRGVCCHVAMLGTRVRVSSPHAAPPSPAGTRDGWIYFRISSAKMCAAVIPHWTRAAPPANTTHPPHMCRCHNSGLCSAPTFPQPE